MTIRILAIGALTLAAVACLCAAPAFAAPAPAPTQGLGAVDVTGAQIKQMLATAPNRSIDRLARSVDIGPYIVSMNVQHRVPGSGVGTSRAGERPVRHKGVTEIYYVLAGKGTFVTGSAMKNAEVLALRPHQPNGENAAGPGDRGDFDGPTVTRTLVAGDVVFVPPMTPHLLKDSDGAFDYLVFRVDPDHVLPANFTSTDLK